MKNQSLTNVFYVYVHKKASNLDIFYVGKGKGNRATSLSGRNKHWKNVVNKYGYIYEIVHDNLSENEAFDLEIKLIKQYMDNGIDLCNKSTGGEGASGVIHSEITKNKFRLAKLGKKQSLEHAAKSRVSRLGCKNTPEHIEKTVQSKRKPVISSSGQLFISTEHACQFKKQNGYPNAVQSNISLCALGKRNNAYGETWSYNVSQTPCFIPTKFNTKKILLKELNIIFKSVQDAKNWVIDIRGKANNQCISQAARNGTKAYSYHWEYL